MIEPLDYAEALAESALVKMRGSIATADQQKRIADLSGIPTQLLQGYATGRLTARFDCFVLIVVAAGSQPGAFFFAERSRRS